MDLSKLTYSKGEPEIIPAEPIINSKIEGVEECENPEGLKVSLAYQKTEGFLSTNLVFVISGGEKREKDFLRELIKQRELHSLRVAFMSEKGQGLQPYQMQDKWEQIQSVGEFKINSQDYHLASNDKVFLLSDVDEFYNQLEKIFKNNSGNQQGKWIVSNPCFEIWLYYCYLNNPDKDLEILRFESVEKRSKKLKFLGNSIVSGGLNPGIAFEHMEIGIKHSLAHYDTDKNGIPVLFATQMYEMAQYLVDTMNNNNNEYSEFVKRKTEWRRLMKNRKEL